MKKLQIKPEIKVGIIGILTIAILIWGINFLKGKNIFNTDNTYYAVFSDLKRLPKSSGVYVNGLRVGTVSKIIYRDPCLRSFLVEFTVNSDIQIPKDSYVAVETELLGSKFLKIVIGDASDFHAECDTVLVNEAGEGTFAAIMGEIKPIKDKAESVLTHLDSVLLAVNTVLDKDGQKNLSEALKNINSMSGHLSSASLNIDNLLQSEKNRISEILANAENITKTLKNNSGKLNNIINNFSNISDTIAKANIAGTLRDANSSLNSLSNIMNKIEKGKGNVGLLLNNDSLYYNLEKTSSNLNALIEDVKANPKRYVKISVF